MKRQWQKTDRPLDNAVSEASENYTPMTLHQLTRPGASKRVVNTKRSSDSKVTPATSKLHANPKGLMRGPGARWKRSKR